MWFHKIFLGPIITATAEGSYLRPYAHCVAHPRKWPLKKERESNAKVFFPCVYKKERGECGNSTPRRHFALPGPIPRGPYFPIATKQWEGSRRTERQHLRFLPRHRRRREFHSFALERVAR